MEKIKDLLNSTCEYALKQGADQCDLLLHKGSALSMSSFEGKIDKYQVSSSQIVGIRVIKDQRVGMASTSLLEQEALEQMSRDALENTKFSALAEHQTIAAEENHLVVTNNYYADDTAVEEKINFAVELEQGVKKSYPQAKVPYTNYHDGESERFYLNHRGCFAYEKSNSFSAYTSALLESGKQNGSFFAATVAHRFKDLSAKHCIDKSLEIAQHFLEAKPCSTGKYDVIFDIDVFGTFLQAFSTLFAAKSAMEGKNRFAKQIGEMVASSGFTLKDRPNLDQALHRHFFDSEGMTTQEVAIIDQGKMNSFLHNQETANFYNTKSTGHAFRAPQSRLSISYTNLYIEPGHEQSIWNGTVLKILKLDGMHSGKNTISGDFSFGASGLLLKDGEIVQPVKGITLSGNFFDLLQQVTAIGTDLLHDEEQSFFAPEIRFSNVDIAG